MSNQPVTAEEIRELRRVASKATSGEWEVHTSCSWRRIGTERMDGGIICPTNHRLDNHPDLLALPEDLAHVAYANPERIIRLCDALLAAQQVGYEDGYKAALVDAHRKCFQPSEVMLKGGGPTADMIARQIKALLPPTPTTAPEGTK